MIKVFEMFAGFGGASFALKKASIPFKCVGFSEIDKHASEFYKKQHGNIAEYGDATKINPDDIPDFDILTGGFPCQAFSIAGKGLGECDTRGTLFYEIIRIAEAKRPKFMLLENVKGLTTQKHKTTFKKIISELKRIDYTVAWKVLNSKNYGIPQSRDRVWFVCVRSDLKYNFKWPESEPLKIFLKDLMDSEVDPKYYLSEERVKSLLKNIINNKNYNTNPGGKGLSATVQSENDKILKCLMAGAYKDPPKILQINNPIHSNDRIYSDEGISPTLNTMQGGNSQHFIMLTSKDCKVRKLTPKECFRAMGFKDHEIDLDGFSDTQLYKMAGNGWDVNLVSKIFKNLLN